MHYLSSHEDQVSGSLCTKKSSLWTLVLKWDVCSRPKGRNAFPGCSGLTEQYKIKFGQVDFKCFWNVVQEGQWRSPGPRSSNKYHATEEDNTGHCHACFSKTRKINNKERNSIFSLWCKWKKGEIWSHRRWEKENTVRLCCSSITRPYFYYPDSLIAGPLQAWREECRISPIFLYVCNLFAKLI